MPAETIWGMSGNDFALGLCYSLSMFEGVIVEAGAADRDPAVRERPKGKTLLSFGRH